MDLSSFNYTSEVGYEQMTPKEQELSRLIGEILHLDYQTFNKRSYFFQIGGDSISAIVLGQKSKEIGLAMSTKDIFTRRTIGMMVKYCQGKYLEVEIKPIIVRYTTSLI
jgi:hypothetical protein